MSSPSEKAIGPISDTDTDATRLRSALAQLLRRTEELADANKRLESFCYSVSHDLRTPLRAISGFAQILGRRHSHNLDEEGRHYMANIVQASSHMSKLIEDLLQYSRLGRQVLTIESVALQDLVEGVVVRMLPELEEANAHVDLPGDLPQVQGDATLLGQIFSNLISNALKYRRPGVKPDVRLTWRAVNDDVVVSVHDNGIGIHAEHLDKIFGVFQRLHSQDDYPGTGIGLATVREAIELIDGSVSVESTVGKGSIFHVTFRASDPASG